MLQNGLGQVHKICPDTAKTRPGLYPKGPLAQYASGPEKRQHASGCFPGASFPGTKTRFFEMAPNGKKPYK